MKLILIPFILAVTLGTSALAAVEPTDSPADPRIKTVVYRERDVVVIKGHYGYSTTIEFGANEVVENVAIGDSVAWQVVRSDSRPNLLFLKPMEANANTNMTVVTNQRIYSFELSAYKSSSQRNKNLSFRIRFTYPGEDAKELADFSAGIMSPSGDLIDGTRPDDWNFDYSFSGDTNLRPVRAFDDGRFTYLQFAKIKTTPAIFLVDDEGNESLVNFTRQGKYMVIERLGRQFTLRDGKDSVACIFNGAFPEPDISAPLAPKQIDAESEEDGLIPADLFDDATYEYPNTRR